MKQKITIMVPTNGKKSCSKALQIAVGIPGVESASLKGDDKSQIEVTGEVDPVKLTIMLRKKMGHAELVSVGEAKKDEAPKPKPKPTEVEAQPIDWSYGGLVPISSYYYVYEAPPSYYYQDASC